MADQTPGTVAWVDLTVPDAGTARDFYAAVVGWVPQPVEMNGYADFNMADPADGTPRAGVCHARGVNAGLPAVWMVYFQVADLDVALAAARERGGEVLQEPRAAGGGRYAVVRDPTGAVCALAGP